MQISLDASPYRTRMRVKTNGELSILEDVPIGSPVDAYLDGVAWVVY